MLHLYSAWIHLHAMDFPGVLEICDSILPSLGEPARRPWRRFHDWYWRMLLEQALTDAWLGKGDLKQAGAEAERFVAATLTTAERTWQALAWEASARVAMAEGDRGHARTCVDKAVAAMEGFEVPLATWRVHASGAELESRLGNQRAAERHRSLGRATVLALASSLVDYERLRETFLAAPPVRAIIDPGRG